MEITLEKIELVKDRTGVSYKEAKEALEKTEGNVVDAIIAIEETIDINSRSKIGEQGSQLMDKIKDAVRKGNVSKITIKKDEEVLLNVPVNIGLIGTVFFPWPMIAAVVAAFGTKCSIELLKEDGEIVDLSEKATETFGTVMEKSANIADEVKEKSADVFSSVKEKASEAMNHVKEDEEELFSDSDFQCDDDCQCGDPCQCDGCQCEEEEK